ncbi:MAG: hypothetical protein LBN31_08585 [Hungatella sp.]|jgi:hypothetical protein|nr:hypothetical protein [Hungatella sp.]
MESIEIIKLGKEIDNSFSLYFESKDRSYVDKLIRYLKNNVEPNWDGIAVSESVIDDLIRYIAAGYIMEMFSFYINYQGKSDLKAIIENAVDLDQNLRWFILKKKYSNIKRRIKADIIEFFRLHKELDKNIRFYFFSGIRFTFWFPQHEVDKYESQNMYKFVDDALREHGISLSHLDADEIMIVKEIYAGLFKTGYAKTIKRSASDRCTSITIQGATQWEKKEPYPYYLVNIHFSRYRNFAKVRFGYMAFQLAGSGDIALFKKYDGYWRYSKICGNWIS